MQVKHATDVEAKEVEMEGASRCKVRWLVAEKNGAPTFAMRQFEIAPGGHAPRHAHDYEHEIYVLEGEGAVVDGDRQRTLRPGNVVFVEPNEVHQFCNTGSGVFKVLCLIPNSAAGRQVTVVPECGVES